MGSAEEMRWREIHQCRPPRRSDRDIVPRTFVDGDMRTLARTGLDGDRNRCSDRKCKRIPAWFEGSGSDAVLRSPSFAPCRMWIPQDHQLGTWRNGQAIVRKQSRRSSSPSALPRSIRRDRVGRCGAELSEVAQGRGGSLHLSAGLLDKARGNGLRPHALRTETCRCSFCTGAFMLRDAGQIQQTRDSGSSLGQASRLKRRWEERKPNPLCQGYLCTAVGYRPNLRILSSWRFVRSWAEWSEALILEVAFWPSSHDPLQEDGLDVAARNIHMNQDQAKQRTMPCIFSSR
jgi:hypothetical protein